MRVCFDTRERIYIPKDVYEYFKQEITRTIMIIRENFDCKVEYKIVENKQSSTSKHEFGNSGFFQFVNVKDFKQFEKAKSCLLSVIQCSSILLSFAQYKAMESKFSQLKNDLKVIVSVDSRTKQIKFYGDKREMAEEEIRMLIKQDSTRYITVKSLKFISRTSKEKSLPSEPQTMNLR